MVARDTSRHGSRQLRIPQAPDVGFIFRWHGRRNTAHHGCHTSAIVPTSPPLPIGSIGSIGSIGPVGSGRRFVLPALVAEETSGSLQGASHAASSHRRNIGVGTCCRTAAAVDRCLRRARSHRKRFGATTARGDAATRVVGRESPARSGRSDGPRLDRSGVPAVGLCCRLRWLSPGRRRRGCRRRPTAQGRDRRWASDPEPRHRGRPGPAPWHRRQTSSGHRRAPHQAGALPQGGGSAARAGAGT